MEFKLALLPFELRAIIWRYAIPNRRVVSLIYDSDQDRYFSFGTPIPSVLHVCKESRAIGLQAYNFCFGTASHPAIIPFCPDRDILFFDDWLGSIEHNIKVDPLWSAERNRIERVAINYGENSETGHYQRQIVASYIDWMKTLFPRLQDLYLVIQNIDPYAKGIIKFVAPVKASCEWCRVCDLRNYLVPVVDMCRDQKRVEVYTVLADRGEGRLFLTDCTSSQKPFASSSGSQEYGVVGHGDNGGNDDDDDDDGSCSDTEDDTSSSVDTYTIEKELSDDDLVAEVESLRLDERRVRLSLK